MFEILIVGAGYAGVTAANRLAAVQDSPVRVTVINPRDRFVERIRLHQYAAGSLDDATVDFASLLHPNVNLVIESVTTIDAKRCVVVLASGEVLEYDYLMYAVGSGQRSMTTDAYSVMDASSTARLRDRLQDLHPTARVEVVGGGLTGIETAAEIAEQFPKLHITLRTGGKVAPGVGERGRQRIRRGLRRLSVEVVEHSPATTNGTSMAGTVPDVVVWCAGFSVPSLAADSGLPVDDHGRLMVNAGLRAHGFDRVFGAGDAAVIAASGYTYHRMSCASAMPMGGHAATSILDLIANREPSPHSNGYLLQCLSLGRRDGLIQFVQRDDMPRAFSLAGRPGAWVKEQVSRLTMRWMRSEARRSGSYSWARGPKLPQSR